LCFPGLFPPLNVIFDHLVKIKGLTPLLLILSGVANDYSTEFPPVFDAYTRYFPHKVDKDEKNPLQGRQ